MRPGIQPTVDFAFKKIFGTPENAPFLLGLANAVLQLRDPLVDVEILNPFSYQEFQDDKLIVLDIRARDTVGRWLNIEMQASVYPGLLQRLAYYACSMYVDQLQAGQHYTRLRPAQLPASQSTLIRSARGYSSLVARYFNRAFTYRPSRTIFASEKSNV